MNVPEELADERYCYLTTGGRTTGRRHTAELWFIPTDGGVYLMSGSGGLTQWCLNLQAEEQGVLRIGGHHWFARAAFLRDDDPDRDRALWSFHEKYDQPDGEKRDQKGRARYEAWLRTAVVAQLVLVRELPH